MTVLFLPSIMAPSYAQTTVIPVNQTTPCFLNYSAGINLWENCGFDDDYLEAIIAPMEWVTGGFFSMIVVSLLITVSYVKYHKAVYPLLIGVIFLPVAYFVFPDAFLIWAVLMAGVTFGILIWYIFLRQTKEYG